VLLHKITPYRSLIAFVVLGLALLTSSCYYVRSSLTNAEAISTANLSLQYEFPEIGLKIKYPADWEKIEYGRAVKAYGEGLIANFFSSLDDKSNKFKEFVQLRIVNSTADNLHDTPTGNRYIGNTPIYQTVFDRPNLANKSNSLTTLKTWFPLSDKILVIEFSDAKSEFSKSLPLAVGILNSVQINSVGVSSTTDAADQSSGLLSNASSSEEKSAKANGNNTQTSTIIEGLLERGINISEAHAD
jgi:hypothetical protein